MQYDIFISYRRIGGDTMVYILEEQLTKKGYSVFWDNSLGAGKVDSSIYEKIKQCKDVILILSPNCLDRCVNKDDWVRKEIEFALKKKKNIIPIMLRGFVWPEELPIEIEEIRDVNYLVANMEYFDQFLDRLCKLFVSEKNVIQPPNGLYQKCYLRIAIMVSFTLGAILLPVIVMFLFKQPFNIIWRIVYAVIIVVIGKWILYSIETRPDIAGLSFKTLTEDDLKKSPEFIFSQLVSAFGKSIFVRKIAEPPFLELYILKRLAFGTWDGKQINYLTMNFQRSVEWYDPSVLYLHALSKNGEAVKMLIRQGFVLRSTPDFLGADIDYLKKDMFHVFLFYKKHRLNRIEIFQCDEKKIKARYDNISEVIKNEKIIENETGETNIISLIIISIIVIIVILLFKPYITDLINMLGII